MRPTAPCQVMSSDSRRAARRIRPRSGSFEACAAIRTRARGNLQLPAETIKAAFEAAPRRILEINGWGSRLHLAADIPVWSQFRSRRGGRPLPSSIARFCERPDPAGRGNRMLFFHSSEARRSARRNVLQAAIYIQCRSISPYRLSSFAKADLVRAPRPRARAAAGIRAADQRIWGQSWLNGCIA